MESKKLLLPEGSRASKGLRLQACVVIPREGPLKSAIGGEGGEFHCLVSEGISLRVNMLLCP